MARTLYRIYLYTISIALLVFAAVSLGVLLNTLFLETGLRGVYESAPPAASVVQNTVLAVTALVVALALGGLHYWLIRRNIEQEPGAETGGVRSLALNLLQAIAALVAVTAGANALGNVGAPAYGGVATTLAVAVVALAAFSLVQWERSRYQPAPGAPLVLQRIHLYLVPSLVLVTGIGNVSRAIADTEVVLFSAAGAMASPCADIRAGLYPSPVEQFTCPLPGRLVGDWLAVLWLVGAWLLYTWLAANDVRSILRAIAHFFGVIVGLVATIVGLTIAANVLLRAALGVQSISAADITSSHDFLPSLIFGLVALFAYRTLLLREAERTALGPVGTTLTLLTLSAIAFGVPLYWGVFQLVQGVVERIIPNGRPPDNSGWAFTFALLVAGLAHPVLAFLVRRQTTETAPAGPRRGYVLAGLAAGALVAAVGLVTAVYLIVTAALGSPVGPDWGVNARQGGAAALVGLFLVGIHLWRLQTERMHAPQPAATPGETGAPVATAPVTIEAVLDQLVAGRITRDQAAAQLHALQRQQVEAHVNG